MQQPDQTTLTGNITTQSNDPPLDRLAVSLRGAFDAVDRLDTLVHSLVDGDHPKEQAQETGEPTGFSSVMSGLRQMPECLEIIERRVEEQTNRLRQAFLDP